MTRLNAGDEPLSVPLATDAVEVLEEFLYTHRDELDSRLRAHGTSLGQILRPEWRRLARLSDIAVSGNANELRGDVADLVAQVNALAREEAARKGRFG